MVIDCRSPVLTLDASFLWPLTYTGQATISIPEQHNWPIWVCSGGRSAIKSSGLRVAANSAPRGMKFGPEAKWAAVSFETQRAAAIYADRLAMPLDWMQKVHGGLDE